MKFAELKAKVRQYMSDEQIREFGPLTRRDTFEAALECCSEAIAVDADHALTDAEVAEFSVTVDEAADQFGVKGLMEAMASTDAALERMTDRAAAIRTKYAEPDAEGEVYELGELPEIPQVSQPMQYGPELVALLPILVLVLTAQLAWRGVQWVWPPVSRWLYHEFIGGLAGAAVLLYRPRLI